MKLSIRWTKPATKDKTKILAYWVKRNGSEKYSEKINTETNRTIKSILQNPHIGNKVKDMGNVRRLLVMKDYSLFYRIKGKYVEIISFWDNRKNPEQIEL